MTAIASPSDHCIVFENAWDDKDCWGPWAEWTMFCEEDWTKQCQEVDDAWYAQDYDWLNPVEVPSECWTQGADRTDDCYMTINTLVSQCNSLW